MKQQRVKRLAVRGRRYLAFIGQHRQKPLDFWFREHKCSSKSSALNVARIPVGTTQLTATLIDNDVQSYPHGGDPVQITNTENFTIEQGAFNNYTGPCPPNFSSFGHDYR